MVFWSGKNFYILLILVLLQIPVIAQTFTFHDEPLLDIITEVEDVTPFRFLYREALIADIRLSFSAEESEVMEKLTESLASTTVGIKVDKERYQALLFKGSQETIISTIRLSGFVIDDETGERLPFSTLSWREHGLLKGIATDQNGVFSTELNASGKELTLLISYVGYKARKITLDLENPASLNELSIRLTPELYGGKEIVIQGVNFYTASDTVMESLLKVGQFNPLGEDNAVRSLQTLPAVTMTTAVSDGINIRGSSADGFRVQLDGQTIYHESHLFGLMDAMNPDVLRSSGFYYNITPAQYKAPLGGTLSLITKSGSVNQTKASAHISNSAASITAEGPIIKGKASWLLSGRHSYLDQVNWLNNQSLIEFGLDVNRPSTLEFQRRLPAFIKEVKTTEPVILDTEAGFYDLHGKFQFETKNGAQFYLSGYAGYDDAYQKYIRDFAELEFEFESKNKWDNKTFASGFSTQINPRLLSQTRAGYSMYDSDYQKDDFEYQLQPAQSGNGRADSSITSPLNLNNEVYEFNIRQSFSFYSDVLNLEFGAEYSDFDVRYQELSLITRSFKSRRTSQLADLFAQADLTDLENITLNLGSRLHYFSNGQYIRWSPRLKFSYRPTEFISWNAGFSRNYQFIHRLELYNNSSTDFWILSNEDQPPSSVDYFTAGIHFFVNPTLYFQIEGYYKHYENLRLHELNAGLISTSFTNFENPWFTDTQGRSKGLELLLKNRLDPITFTTAYTLSSAELSNDRINNGAYFYANWDRRHQLSTAADLSIAKGLNIYISWMYGTGTPNLFDVSRFVDTPRLPDYSRVDLSLKYTRVTSLGSIKAAISVYNILNRNNPWYDELRPVTLVNVRDNEIRARAMTHIYDLGIQPSFSLGFYF